jgi:hypothetical protein
MRGVSLTEPPPATVLLFLGPRSPYVANNLGRLTVEATGRDGTIRRATLTSWFTNAIAFGLAYWEVECGGPVVRALATAARKPDFQFPQDDNPQLAREGWVPRLWDYFYISLTNATAFSPTDAMPLTRPGSRLRVMSRRAVGLG